MLTIFEDKRTGAPKKFAVFSDLRLRALKKKFAFLPLDGKIQQCIILYSKKYTALSADIIDAFNTTSCSLHCPALACAVLHTLNSDLRFSENIWALIWGEGREHFCNAVWRKEMTWWFSFSQSHLGGGILGDRLIMMTISDALA